jgi:chain length determinant protein EpsF
MSFRQFLLVLRARWPAVLAIFLLAVCGALAVGLLSPKLYTATATVVIDNKTDPVEGVAQAAQISSGYIATQVDIISSERVAQRVVKNLKLDADPASIEEWRSATGGRGDATSWIAEKLQKRLAVTPSRDSSVIEISFNWTDPRNAALFANAFAQAYIDTNIELKVDPAKQYAKWFAERSQQLRADLQAKQKKLTDFEAKTGIVNAADRLGIENARLEELSTQLVAIQAQRQDSQSRQKPVGSDVDSLPEVLQSPLIANLKADLSRAQAKLQDIATTLGKNHPDYQTTAAQIASLKQRIHEESATIAASLGETTQVNVRREAEVRAALEAQKQRILAMNQNRDDAAVLQGDVVAAQRDLDAITQQLTKTSLESQSEHTNVALLTPALEPLYRSSPRYSINLLIGALLGAILGIGFALLREISDRRIRDDSELPALLGVPQLGTIPEVRAEPRPRRNAPVVLSRVEPSTL